MVLSAVMSASCAPHLVQILITAYDKQVGNSVNAVALRHPTYLSFKLELRLNCCNASKAMKGGL